MSHPSDFNAWGVGFTGGGSKLPPQPGYKVGTPYRYVIEANAENVEIRLCTMNVILRPDSVDETQYALAVFKQGGCLMVRDGQPSILPPKLK